jgi:TRAP-type C4-dicarboxylate transport system permease large subunit
MRKWESNLVVGLIFIFFTGDFFDDQRLIWITAFGTLMVIVISLIQSKGLPKVFGMLMLLAGTFILWIHHVSLFVWAESLMKNLPIISLILLVPILSIPIELGKYGDQIRSCIQSMSRKPSLLFLSISSTFYVLGPILNMGSIRVVDSMIDRLKFPKEFLAKVYTRGFTSVITWSPYFASVFIVIYFLNVPLTTFLPFGFVMGLIQFGFGNMLFLFIDSKKFDFPTIEKSEVKKVKLVELVVVISILTGAVFLSEHYIDMNMMILVTLTVIIVTVAWAIYLRKVKQFGKEVSRFFQSLLPGRSNEIVLFLTSGFFGSALSYTPAGSYLKSLLIQLSQKSLYLLIFSTILIVAVFAFLGIHQVVTISLIISIISAHELGITNVTLGLAFLSSWAIATMASPVSAVNVIISSLLKIKITKLLRYNFLFMIGTLMIHTTLIYIFHLLLI